MLHTVRSRTPTCGSCPKQFAPIYELRIAELGIRTVLARGSPGSGQRQLACRSSRSNRHRITGSTPRSARYFPFRIREPHHIQSACTLHPKSVSALEKASG
jgi:hypothetical protein